MIPIPRKFLDKLRAAQGQKAIDQKVSTPRSYVTQVTPRSRTQAPQSMEEYMKYAMGPQQAFYTNTGGGGGSMSMSPLAGSGGGAGLGQDSKGLGNSDALVGKLGGMLSSMNMRYADGGKVGVTANALKTLKEALSHLQSKDRARAVQTLRNSREAMANPSVGRSAEDILGPNPQSGMDRLKQMIEEATNQTKVPLLAEGGMVPDQGQEQGQMGDADPQMLYAEYQHIMQALESGQLEEKDQMEAINRLQEIETALSAMGIQIGEEEQQQPEQGGADVQGMLSQLQQGAAGMGIG